MIEQYIFTITASGDRTNIIASFPLWNKQMFLESVKQGKNYGRYRYGKIGGYISLLKDMYLEEFDSIFSPAEFTSKEITQIFRKEISEKYGEHAEKAKIKPLSKKELERGCVYEDFSGHKYIYFGEVEQTIDGTYLKHYQSEKKPLEINKGYGFDRYWRAIPSEHILDANIDILKSPKKLMKRVEGIKFNLESEYIYESGAQRWAKEHRTVLRLL